MAGIGDLLVDQFFRTSLTATIVAGAGTTEIFVDSVSGLPVPTGNEYFYFTLVDGDVAETVKIGAVDVGAKKLTTFGATTIQLGFAASTSRAELWFTAEAFEDIQAYLIGLATSSYPGVDDASIEAAATLRIKLLGVLTGHLEDGAVTNAKLFNNAVGESKIQSGAVTNVKIAAVDGGKITTGTVPAARIQNLTFANLTYTDGGTPSGLTDGDIHFTFKA